MSACDLRLGDAFDLLGSLEPESVDVTICDPPFDQRTSDGMRSAAHGMRDRLTVSPIDFRGLTPEQVAILAGELVRVSTRWVICFCALEQLGAYQRAAGPAWVRAGVWRKPDPAPQFTGDRPGQAAEGVAIMHRPGRKHWNGGGGPAFWTLGVCRTEREHPTQKPIPLMLEIVRLFSDLGELILDPFAGSGTTAVAALRLGRRFLGSEIDPRYHAVALERIAAEGSCSSLAAHRAGQLGLLEVET